MFDDETETTAPPEEVWKALYDPARFPEWWAGIQTAAPGDAKGGDADVTFYPDGYPDFPMPQHVTTHNENRRVTVSCTVSDLVFEWRLAPLDGDAGTHIAVHVEIPAREAARLQTQRQLIGQSLRNLAALAAS
jgi:uncharacterized protein YndB with AHSA1/START domain